MTCDKCPWYKRIFCFIACREMNKILAQADQKFTEKKIVDKEK